MERPSKDYIEVAVDEVGRGSLISDVVAAAVIMPCHYDEDDEHVHLIKDSKKCSKKQLRVLNTYIQNVAIAWGIGKATCQEIDERNILNATMLAMHRALDAVYEQVSFDTIAIDGNHFKPYMSPCINDSDESNYIPHRCYIGGDNTHLNIAAASILAKVNRDDSVIELHNSHPKYSVYGWDTNFGYGTVKHFEAIKQHGITDKHRMTFVHI
jgi:ribonuclease HII